jgi:hypothetical protein
VHLGEHGSGRRTLPLQSFDALQPVQNRTCFVHVSTLAGASARVCVRTVSKAVRFLPAVAPNPDRELGDARGAIDRGDGLAALKSLDRARRGYLKERDSDGLEHVLRMADLVEASDDRARIGRENLAYAVKQNLRQESRRRARESGTPWNDPFPDLRAPTEHTGLVLTTPVKLVIGLGVIVGTALLLALVIAPFFDTGKRTVTLRLVNDTPENVTVRGCDDSACASPWLRRDLEAGQETDTEVDRDQLVELFRVERAGRESACLAARVHDGYLQLDGKGGALAVRLSEATACPGATVLPEPAGEPSL